MIQIYADGTIVYDSRQEDYDLLGLNRTAGLNKGGTAEITMPPDHPAYNRFVWYRTIVEIYRDGKLRFRGRALYHKDNFDKERTVVCEGELCFLQDAILRPYRYSTTPALIFESMIGIYNAQVEPYKRFKLGTMSVMDAEDTVIPENENAETVLAGIQRILKRCGGYVVFTTDPGSGERVIHWLESIGKVSTQTIEFGENLFDYAENGANSDLATALLPYGARNEETGLRLTIADVNNGVDFIQDEEAVSIRGTIMKTEIWDDVTSPASLLKKARQRLDELKILVTSLELTALDLSIFGMDVDGFELGDWVHARSIPHGLDEMFRVSDINENMLNPAKTLLNLGREVGTLTSRDVSGDLKSSDDLRLFAIDIKQKIQRQEQRIAALEAAQ